MNSDNTVFSINFIRKPFLPLHIKQLIVCLVVVYFAVQTLILLSMLSTASITNFKSNRLEKLIIKQSPSSSREGIKTEMNELKNELSNCLSQLNAFIKIEEEQFQVADKLAALSRTLPRRTWLTDLEGDQSTRTLKMKAVYLVNPKNKSQQAVTQEWFNAFRADPDFGDGIKHIELQKFSEKRQGSANLNMFEIFAEWQPDAGVSHAVKAS